MKRISAFLLSIIIFLICGGTTSAYSVVFMGDSITEMWWGYHQNDFFTPNSFLGKGVGGHTTANMNARFQKDVVAWNPKVVVILAGANDVARNGGYVPFEEIVANIGNMARIASEAGAEVVIMSILPVDTFSWNLSLKPSDDIRVINSLLLEMTQECGYTWVDLYPALVNPKGGLEEWVTIDKVHLYASGYELIEQILMPYLEELV